MSSMFGVGASWVKTRISTYILIGAGLLAIGTIFLACLERQQFDGTYCATMYWTNSSGFFEEYWKQQLADDLKHIPKGVARVCYKDSIYVNGWSQLELETQSNYPDWIQAYGAGILEGVLTWKNIYHQWSNTIQTPCDQDEDSQKFCQWLREKLFQNYEKTKEHSQSHASDHYWHQVNLYYHQLEGLYVGWQRGAKRSRSGLEEDIEFYDFLLMNAAADIPDLKMYYQNFVLGNSNKNTLNRNFIDGKATLLFNLIQNNVTSEYKLLIGHSSKGSYSSMLRMQKRYKFSYHLTADPKASTISGNEIIFTGYPGILASTDDFYMVYGKKLNFIVSGVAIKNHNVDLLEKINFNNMLPLSIRIMTANRLSSNSRTWDRIMSRHPISGSKQWVVIDLRKLDQQQLIADKFGVQKETVPGLVTLLEQLPGITKSSDMKELFVGPLCFDGLPKFSDILDSSGLSRDNFSEMTNCNGNITTLSSIDVFFRQQAFRGDLLGDQSIPYGNIDLKLFSYEPKLGVFDYHAVSGPLFTAKRDVAEELILTSNDLTLEDETISNIEIRSTRPVRNDIMAIAKYKNENRTPFKWSQVNDQIESIPHIGHPDEFNFDKVKPKWAWTE